MNISWTSEAYDSWCSVADYILHEFGEMALQKFYQNTEEWQDVLSASPLAGKVEPLLKNRKIKYRSITISKQNKLIYYIEDTTIYIAALWDTRREPTNQANNLK